MNGLNLGRNSIGKSHKLSAQQVKEIQNRILLLFNLSMNVKRNSILLLICEYLISFLDDENKE
jgi:hypothetical protein